MDACQTHPTGTDVTIQAASPDQGVSRGLARGILLSQLAVMAPDPPPELLRTSSALIAVIAQGLASGGPQEAIPVASTTRLRLRSPDLNSACVMLRLARPVQHAPAGPRHSAEQITEALRVHQGSLWEAMASLGYTSLTSQPGGTQSGGTHDGDGPWDYEANSLEEFGSIYCVIHPDACKKR
jgi:hypothetical protein